MVGIWQHGPKEARQRIGISIGANSRFYRLASLPSRAQQLAVGSNNSAVFIWDTSLLQQPLQWQPRGSLQARSLPDPKRSKRVITAIDFNPTANILMASPGGDAWIRDLSNGNENTLPARLRSDEGPVQPRRNFAWLRSAKTTLLSHIWDTFSGAELDLIPQSKPVVSMLFARNGSRLVTWTRDSLRDEHAILVWRVSTTELGELATMITDRQLTPTEQKKYLPQATPTAPFRVGAIRAPNELNQAISHPSLKTVYFVLLETNFCRSHIQSWARHRSGMLCYCSMANSGGNWIKISRGGLAKEKSEIVNTLR